MFSEALLNASMLISAFNFCSAVQQQNVGEKKKNKKISLSTCNTELEKKQEVFLTPPEVVT